MEGEGWIPFDQLKERACRHWCDMNERPKVTSLLVAYQTKHFGHGGTVSMTPVEFGIMKQRYEANREGFLNHWMELSCRLDIALRERARSLESWTM